MEQLTYGSSVIEFELIYTNRKTLGITVHPDSSVEVKAPLEASKGAFTSTDESG